MKILKNCGTFTILSKPENVIKSIAGAARTCYQTKGNTESDVKLVKRLLDRGHTAMLEFGDITVRFDNVCRGFTHEAVRHRLCSYAQESTRYVDESDFNVVVPPHKNEDEHYHIPDADFGHNISLRQWFELNEKMYRGLRKEGWKPEDARQVLPIAIKAQIVHKANITEWRHIFKMRCDKHAHWEIRNVMLKLLSWCQENIPVVFADFHFFDNRKYARPIMSKDKMRDTLFHYLLANGIDANVYLKEFYDDAT